MALIFLEMQLYFMEKKKKKESSPKLTLWLPQRTALYLCPCS